MHDKLIDEASKCLKSIQYLAGNVNETAYLYCLSIDSELDYVLINVSQHLTKGRVLLQ